MPERANHDDAVERPFLRVKASQKSDMPRVPGLNQHEQQQSTWDENHQDAEKAAEKEMSFQSSRAPVSTGMREGCSARVGINSPTSFKRIEGTRGTQFGLRDYIR
ncbi:hypothetical protein OHD62_00520 [Mesorhizobium sp. YC-39]|uniref:hypothetical protein n=1 Tax=unclassified Mesorhizobium TaxID=325217 RepID=UPI0021E8387C|nr:MULTISPECIES: hypothetical protein [unclassified Mesorhizobium]MCV3206757.1 hypothetical protein [Mesorhizobium sp. YC-2]MCV3226843.1 hypothetical protein [Mesorhizobium sp. YC-39]